MGPYRSFLVLMGSNGDLCVPMIHYASLSFLMGLYRFLRVLMGLYRSL